MKEDLLPRWAEEKLDSFLASWQTKPGQEQK